MSKKKQRKAPKEQEALLPGKEKNRKFSPESRGSMVNWLLVLLAVLPFLVSGNPLDPVLTPRYIFLSLFLLLFAVYFFLFKKKFVNFRSLPPAARLVFILGLAFAGWSFLSMINSINYREGFMDSSRQLLNLLFLYVVMTALLEKEGQLMRIAKTLTIVALLQSFAGILQYYDIAFGSIPGANAKPFGLMANRNFFGSAQVYIMPFVVYTLYSAGRRWKWIAGIALAGLVMSIMLSQTRSAWLAAVVFFATATILITIFSPSQRKKWLLGSGIAILASALVVSLLLAGDSEGELKESVRERAASLTGTIDAASSVGVNASERLKIWKKTTQIIRDHPFLGVGPGNWKIVLPSYGTDNMQFAEGIFSPDRPHNVYLQVASETGIPGAILYFGTWAIIALCGFRFVIRGQPENLRVAVIIMLAGLAAVASDFMFSFPTDRIEHSLYIFLMGGIILSCYANQSAKEKRGPYAGRVLLAPVFIIILFNLFLAFKKLNFEVAWKHANAYNSENRFAETIEEAGKGKNSFVVMDESGVPLELFTARAYKEMKDNASALREIRKAAVYHPNNARIYSEWGTIYTGMEKYDSAIYFYEKSLKLTPRYDVPLKNLAVNYFAVHRDSDCINVLNRTNIENEPYLKDMLRQAKEAVAAKAGKN